MDYWLSAVQDCSWLLPLQQKLYIVCDAGQQILLQSWAANSAQARQCGFLGGKQLLPAQLGSSAAADQVAVLSAIAATGSLPDLLILIDGASLCEPDFCMHRFIQHALVRNKDTVAFSTAPGYDQLNQQFQLELYGSSANPQVRGITQVQPGVCSSDGLPCSPYAVPVFAIKGTSIPKLQQSGSLHLCAALQTLMASADVYSLPVQCSFDLSTLDGYLYAAAFFDFYQQHWKLLHLVEDKAQGLPSEVTIATDVVWILCACNNLCCTPQSCLRCSSRFAKIVWRYRHAQGRARHSQCMQRWRNSIRTMLPP